MNPCVLIAGIFHETHTFVEETTGLADFQIRRGNEMLQCAGDASPLGGVLEHARDHGWRIQLAIDYRATPSGTVEDEVVESWWREFESAWTPDCDAVFLVLHGAMTAQTHRDAEGVLLARIRQLTGSGKPIFGVYDLHANISHAMAAHADCLVAYRENPHTDARESALRAAVLLDRCLTTTRPRMHLRQANILLPPTGVGTADDPMNSLEAAAREFEGGDIWVVNIASGFAFADTPDTGLSFQVVTTGSSEVAELKLSQLEQLAEELKEHGRGQDESLDAIMTHLQQPANGLTVLVEPADNIGGGAPGDCTGCLRALLEHDVDNAAVCLNDPEAVAQLTNVEIGSSVTLPLGGKGSRLDLGPVELEVELLSQNDGRFELEDKQSHLASMVGNIADMGPCAVVRHHGLTLLLTSRRIAPFDLGQWRSQGIDPAALNVIVVKAAVAHRRAYDPITARTFLADTPGPCTSNLSRFPYQYLRPGLWPFA